MTDDYHRQLRQRVARAKQAEIDITADRVHLFLQEQRCLKHNADWFTVADVVRHLDIPDHHITCVCSVGKLSAAGKIETFQHRFRHC